MNYLLIDADGEIQNRIIWDGVSDYTPPEGWTLIPESEHPESQEP